MFQFLLATAFISKERTYTTVYEDVGSVDVCVSVDATSEYQFPPEGAVIEISVTNEGNGYLKCKHMHACS